LILDFENGWLFIKTTKVGGTSVEVALSRIASPTAIITPLKFSGDAAKSGREGYAEARNFDLPWREYGKFDKVRRVLRGRKPPPAFGEHDPAWKVRDRIGDATFDALFKVSIVRNPFDQIVSRYRWEIAKGRLAADAAFQGYLFAHPEKLLENRRIMSADGRCAMSFVVRYESLIEDFARIAGRIGADDRFIEDLQRFGINAGSGGARAAPARYYDEAPDCLDLVRLLCAEEIERYGYDGPST
jgi:hypothetical protein